MGGNVGNDIHLHVSAEEPVSHYL